MKMKSIFALAFRGISSVGSEHLPYKQRVGGSTPSSPTMKMKHLQRLLKVSVFLFARIFNTTYINGGYFQVKTPDFSRSNRYDSLYMLKQFHTIFFQSEN